MAPSRSSDKCGAVLGHELFDRHRWTTADLRNKGIRSSEHSILRFNCGCPAVLFEKSIAGLASHVHAVKAARCLLMNSSSVVGGRPPIFSTRSFVPANIPF